jgi:hypothetical protein
MGAMTARSAIATALLGATGCAASVEARGHITSVDPPAIYSDVPFDMEIQGESFWASYRIDTVGGSGNLIDDAFVVTLRPPGDVDAPAPVAATSVGWFGEDRLMAEMPAGIPAGVYDVAVTDPRGETFSLPNGFTSLGPDREPPTVELVGLAPGTLLGASTTQDLRFRATDRFGWLSGLRWRAWTDSSQVEEQECTVASVAPPGATTECFVVLKLPDMKEAGTLSLELTALDSAVPEPNVTTLPATFPVAPPPTTLGVCIPEEGPASGETLVQIPGSNFVPGQTRAATQIIIRDAANNDTYLSQQEGGTPELIWVKMPKASAGPVTVIVTNGGAAASVCTFTFRSPPIVRDLKPRSGPETGGTRIAIVGNRFPPDATVSLVGDGVRGELTDLHWVSESRLEATMPPGTGKVGVVVHAGLNGDSPAYYGFDYTPLTDSPGDAGCEAPLPLDCDAGSTP